MTLKVTHSKRELGRAALAAVMAGLHATSLVACSSAEQGGRDTPAAAQANRDNKQIAFDGETVFRGVLLGHGPVAKLLPEVWESPHVQAATDTRNVDATAYADWLDKAADHLRTR